MGKKKLVGGQKGHSDVPADEMLSDEYYEQDGEDQSDSMHYRGFNHSNGLNSRSRSVSNNFSRSSRDLNNNEEDDDGDYNNDHDADYEEEDEEDGNLLAIAVFSFVTNIRSETRYEIHS